MPAFIELYFLVRDLRERKQPGPCRKCRGPIIAPGATCPACGFRLGSYVNAQWSRFLRGMAVGILVGGLGTLPGTSPGIEDNSLGNVHRGERT
jgi:hypothetical protein